MSSGFVVIRLSDDSRYVKRLGRILGGMSGQRKLEYIVWLRSIGFEVQL